MPSPDVPLAKLGFLTIGSFDGADPGPGHRTTLEVIELGERLGFDSAWVRNRHLQYGISSPVAVLAAASQRTRRIELGTAVIPLAWENPLRLAEDLATVDVLSGGRLNAGVSVGPPMHWASSRSGRTGCSRTRPGCGAGSGTAAPAWARHGGPAGTA
jgi:alkanesulfonate monooxygenase SsuD/methylene tetrahydromethanopterin reductase-like flavin-dependent oxidoreductase (luciferase family)